MKLTITTVTEKRPTLELGIQMETEAARDQMKKSECDMSKRHTNLTKPVPFVSPVSNNHSQR